MQPGSDVSPSTEKGHGQGVQRRQCLLCMMIRMLVWRRGEGEGGGERDGEGGGICGSVGGMTGV